MSPWIATARTKTPQRETWGGHSRNQSEQLVAITRCALLKVIITLIKRRVRSADENGTQNQESRRFIRFAASLLTKILKFQRVENASVFSLSLIGDFEFDHSRAIARRRGKPPLRFPKGDG
jgi:hypothetical protein